MVVIVLIAAAEGLRGHLTRWLVEIAPGVLVGNPGARVRDKLWETISGRIKNGQAIMIFRERNEQGWQARTAGINRWKIVDHDGLTLVRRPARRVPDEGQFGP